jgi:predicted nicotinamide N-methyase
MNATIPTHDARVGKRIMTLTNHLEPQFGFESQEITVPDAGRVYEILTPSTESIERMFAEAPPHLKPFWSRVWPSGVALADVVLSWRDRMAGQRVLELGSGLGVTATAALEAGATVIAADFSEIALTYCRLNALRNSGKALRTLPPLDWRDPSPLAATRLNAYGQFSLILAADVLYDSGDILPLMRLIDRILAPDGTVLLAEPGRKTAERFLIKMAEEGWHGQSKAFTLPWSSRITEHVNVHVLHRPDSAEWLGTSLGGWST